MARGSCTWRGPEHMQVPRHPQARSCESPLRVVPLSPCWRLTDTQARLSFPRNSARACLLRPATPSFAARIGPVQRGAEASRAFHRHCAVHLQRQWRDDVAAPGGPALLDHSFLVVLRRGGVFRWGCRRPLRFLDERLVEIFHHRLLAQTIKSHPGCPWVAFLLALGLRP